LWGRGRHNQGVCTRGMCLKNPIAEPKPRDWILASGSFDRFYRPTPLRWLALAQSKVEQAFFELPSLTGRREGSGVTPERQSRVCPRARVSLYQTQSKIAIWSSGDV
jgi:hypothetical protein